MALDSSTSRLNPSISDANPAFERPRWLRDLTRFLPLKPQFVLSGNVRDLQLTEVNPGSVVAQPLLTVLAAELRATGYDSIIVYDLVSGFRLVPRRGEQSGVGAEVLGRLGLQSGTNGSAPAGLELFAETLDRVVNLAGEPVALVVDFSSRLIIRTGSLTVAEHAAFTRALILSHQAKPRPHGNPARPFLNTIVWVTDKEGDLPDWFLVGNPRVRRVPVAKPDNRTRRVLATALLRGLVGYREAAPEAATLALNAFTDATEGLLLIDLAAIQQLASSDGIAFADVADAVRRYKVGVTEDPWARIPIEKIKGGSDWIRARVKGQDHAVTHVMDIVKRAVTGVGSPRRGSRPRGVAFFAGPTGVGKTELAKTLTRLLFGDEQAYIRFDMSEFSAEHSDQRLVGAPPGYVGYDVGGELTNAIRERPLSVVLFDEIEKAHPRILDKFLQILDDGVLTSGRGDRVYFSESFIVFTSNLGIYRSELDGSRVANVSSSDAFEDVRTRVRAEIERHFKLTLNRPEILNRIGENILVFDFIREEVAGKIFDTMVSELLADAATAGGWAVALGNDARRILKELCVADLSNGGRGVRNKIEAHLVNPLARALFDMAPTTGERIVITSVDANPNGTTTIQLTSGSGSS
jgi:energy-coupling factor transporter ATP-binding protein EcfA2